MERAVHGFSPMLGMRFIVDRPEVSVAICVDMKTAEIQALPPRIEDTDRPIGVRWK